MKKYLSKLLRLILCGTATLLIAACYGVPAEVSEGIQNNEPSSFTQTDMELETTEPTAE